jgi:hypothetical protein
MALLVQNGRSAARFSLLLILAALGSAEWIPPGIGVNYGGSAYSSKPLNPAAAARIIQDRKIPMVKVSPLANAKKNSQLWICGKCCMCTCRMLTRSLVIDPLSGN